jgi:hypothetical protein
LRGWGEIDKIECKRNTMAKRSQLKTVQFKKGAYIIIEDAENTGSFHINED